jgi:ureidoacrylate peracid hydrolase
MLRVPYKMLLAPIPAFPLRADNAALLLIDVQHFTTTRSRGIGRMASERGIDREFDEYFLQAEAALKNIARLVEACRAHRLSLLHTVLCARNADRTDMSRQMQVSELPLPVGDPRKEIRDEAAPIGDEPVFPRTTYSPFADPAFAEALNATGRDTLLVAGMLANMSVWQTACEAADCGFGVIVVSDCCASETFAWHTQFRTGVVGGLIRERPCHAVIEMLEGTRT